MLRPFEDLGKTVEQKWKNAGYSTEHFSEIATEALSSSGVLNKVEPNEIVSWLMSPSTTLEQRDSDFGQPPVNLYLADNFRIEALFWIDSSTRVHEHSFAGAFGVLAGESVHSKYRFEPEKAISRRFVVGRTKFIEAELLEQGAVRPILPDDRLIHALFHLARPSVSIVVRTTRRKTERPQYGYQKPFIAVDPFNVPSVQTVQLRMLQSLLAVDPASFWKSAAEIAGTSPDPWMLYHVLAIAYRKSDDQANWTQLLRQVNPEHQELLHYIVPCLRQDSRDMRITLLRSAVHDPTHRFFLALLLNVPTRSDLYRLIAERFGNKDPESLILQWLGEIFSEKRMGVRLTSSSLFLLQLMLKDPDFDRSKQFLRNSFENGNFEEQQLREAWTRIHSIDMFDTLLENPMEPALVA